MAEILLVVDGVIQEDSTGLVPAFATRVEAFATRVATARRTYETRQREMDDLQAAFRREMEGMYDGLQHEAASLRADLEALLTMPTPAQHAMAVELRKLQASVDDVTHHLTQGDVIHE